MNVHEVDEVSGWWQGTVNGRTGSFPGGFVVVTELSQEEIESSEGTQPFGESAEIHTPNSDAEGEWEDGEWIDDDWEEGEWEQGEIVESSPSSSRFSDAGELASLPPNVTQVSGDSFVPPSPPIRKHSFLSSHGRSRMSQDGPDTSAQDRAMAPSVDRAQPKESPKNRRDRKEDRQEPRKKTPPPRPFREKRVPIPPQPKGDTTRIISTLYRNDLGKPARPPPVPVVPAPSRPLPSSLHQAAVSLSPCLQFIPLE